MEDKYSDVFADHTIPLSCPFEGCEFSTGDFDSDQFGHHKKKLVKHLGSFHDLFKQFVLGRTSVRKNYEESSRFTHSNQCRICMEPLSSDYDEQTSHYFMHFRKEIENDFIKEIFADFPILKCPLCDTTADETGFISIGIHIGTKHGVFDKKIDEYTRNLDYASENSCRVCSKAELSENFRRYVKKNVRQILRFLFKFTRKIFATVLAQKSLVRFNRIWT